MQYAYTAKSQTGETASGMVAVESLADAHRQLRSQGLYVVSIKPAKGKVGANVATTTRRKGVSRKELMVLTSHLAIMTKAGIDFAGAVNSLARQALNPVLRDTLTKVHQDITGGNTISASLRNQADVFDTTYVATVAAGEASGQLPEVLHRLSIMQRTELRSRSARRALLAYPMVLTSVASLVVMGLMFFVLPQFAEIFEQSEMPLPMITQVLLTISEELSGRSWLWLSVAAAAFVGLGMLRRSEFGRRQVDYHMLHLALLRDVTRPMLLGRAFRLLGIMIESGVPLLEGLRLTKMSITNKLFRSLFDSLEREVVNGRTLAGALAGVDYLPSGAAEMIGTAERTGSLANVTQVMGEFYEEEGETKLRELTVLIEPLIIVLMGVIVAMIVLAVMLPMFDLTTFGQGH